MAPGSDYKPSGSIRTDFIEDLNGRVDDSTSCGGELTDPITGITQTVGIPTYAVTSTPTGVNEFMVLDQIKGEFRISPRT